MGRTKTVVEVPIQKTRCWRCRLLERIQIEDSKGNVIKRFRCPKHMVLPWLLPPFFADKCELFKPKEGVKPW